MEAETTAFYQQEAGFGVVVSYSGSCRLSFVDALTRREKKVSP